MMITAPEDKVRLIRASLRAHAARMVEPEPPPPIGPPPPPPLEPTPDISPIDSDRVTFVGPSVEDSFSETTLLDLITNPRPAPPVRERNMDDVYERLIKLEGGVEFLIRGGPENRCMMSPDIRVTMAKVEDGLDRIDRKQSELKLGPFKLTLKWGSIIGLLLALSQLNGKAIFASLLAIF